MFAPSFDLLFKKFRDTLPKALMVAMPDRALQFDKELSAYLFFKDQVLLSLRVMIATNPASRISDQGQEQQREVLQSQVEFIDTYLEPIIRGTINTIVKIPAKKYLKQVKFLNLMRKLLESTTQQTQFADKKAETVI